MNKIIEKQLKQVQIADLTDFNKDTNTYNIPKFCQKRVSVGECYIIKLDRCLLSKTSSEVFANNWNKGSIPPFEYMKVDISKILGKNIFVNGIGFDFQTKQDINEMWSGWLPLTQITIEEQI